MNYEDRKLILYVVDHLSYYFRWCSPIAQIFESIYQRFETNQYIQDCIDNN